MCICGWWEDGADLFFVAVLFAFISGRCRLEGQLRSSLLEGNVDLLRRSIDVLLLLLVGCGWLTEELLLGVLRGSWFVAESNLDLEDKSIGYKRHLSIQQYADSRLLDWGNKQKMLDGTLIFYLPAVVDDPGSPDDPVVRPGRNFLGSSVPSIAEWHLACFGVPPCSVACTGSHWQRGTWMTVSKCCRTPVAYRSSESGGRWIPLGRSRSASVSPGNSGIPRNSDPHLRNIYYEILLII